MKGNKSTITEILPLKSGVLHRLPLCPHYRGSGQFFLEDGKELLLCLVPLPRCCGGGGGRWYKREEGILRVFFFSETFYPVINCITSTLSLALRKRLALLYN